MDSETATLKPPRLRNFDSAGEKMIIRVYGLSVVALSTREISSELKNISFLLGKMLNKEMIECSVTRGKEWKVERKKKKNSSHRYRNGKSMEKE